MDFEIVTDSSANLPEEWIEEYNIHVLSLCFYVDGEECYSYEEGKKTDFSKFYKMMREKKEIRTSLVNTEKAFSLCEGLLRGGKDILYIGFSSGLSGSFQSVKIALEGLKDSYPERNIYCVDTLAAALGEGLLVKRAVDLRKEGMEISDVYQWILDNRLNVCHWFTVDDLFFLKRGGRISTATATLGTALNIKPVLHVDDEGHLVMVGKERGRKKSLEALVKHLEENITDTSLQEVFISHGDCREDAEYVMKKVEERVKIKDFLIHILDPVIGAHSGPGTVALFFMGKKR